MNAKRLVQSRAPGAGIPQNSTARVSGCRAGAALVPRLDCAALRLGRAGAARSRGLRPLHSRLRIRSESIRQHEGELIGSEPRTGAVVRQNDGQSERLQSERALAPRWYRAWTAQRCALAALGPLVLAAFGRSTRGSESAANLFASMKAKRLVQSRAPGAGIRQNSGQSERLPLAPRWYRALQRRAGAARSRGLRPLHSRLRIRSESIRQHEGETITDSDPRTGAVVRQNDGQSERLPRWRRGPCSCWKHGPYGS
jgi:uncharacterized C2H2 Zn-finger protein